MITTPLLSLSVHDTLAFDGTEIALHPDIFSDGSSTVVVPGGGSSLVGNSSVSTTPTATKPLSGTTMPPSHRPTRSDVLGSAVSGSASITGTGLSSNTSLPRMPLVVDPSTRLASNPTSINNNEGIGRPPVVTSRQNSTATTAGSAQQGVSTATKKPSCLEVGTMIEIRVWDQLPPTSPKRRLAASSNRRSSPKAISSNASDDSLKRTSGKKTITSSSYSNFNTTTNTLEAASSSLQMSFPSNSSIQNSSYSLQYSVESAPVSTKGSPSTTENKSSPRAMTTVDASTLSSTDHTPPVVSTDASPLRVEQDVPATVVANAPQTSNTAGGGGRLPPLPLFPRARANTSDTPKAGGLTSTTLTNNRIRIKSSTGDGSTKGNTTKPDVVTSSTIPKPAHQRASSLKTLPPSFTASAIPIGGANNPTTAMGTTTKRGGTSTLEKPRHVRDISDMTTDTMIHVAAASNAIAGISPVAEQQQAPGSNATSKRPTNVFLPSSPSSEIMTGLAQSHSLDSCMETSAAEEEKEDMLTIVSKTHEMRLSFVMLVKENTFSIKGSAKTKVSVLRQVADLYNLSSYDMVTITRIQKADEASVLEDVSADFVVVTIKDQFISRGEMHYFQRSLLGKWIYEGERLTDSKTGVKCKAKEIRHKNRMARSGVITNDTVITFRSMTARIMWLVQISSEMWDYASPYETDRGENESSCDIYFDKFVKTIDSLFQKWKELDVTHSLTVVFFSRTFLGTSRPGEATKKTGIDTCNVDVYGRFYEDHFKTVIENDRSCSWDSIVRNIKRKFIRYPFELGWNFTHGNGGRWPSNAMQGNVLEAINVTLNLQHLHYMDRDLERTGNSIVVVSPGCGVFEVDKELAGITHQRMMDDGIGSDMLCLGLPPLHIAPFFLYNNAFYEVGTDGVDADKTYYEVPHWMHLSFVSYDKDETRSTRIKPHSELLNSIPSQGDLQAFSGTHNEMRVAANGFLMPVISRRPDLAKRSASELESDGSEAQTQQRALIEGRDFEDILEACRPKLTANSMPSSLKALFNLHRQVREEEEKSNKGETGVLLQPQQEIALDNEKEQSSHGSETAKSMLLNIPTDAQPMREWGSVNFDELAGTNMILPPSERGSPMLATIDNSDRSESSEKSSPSSSFASVFSQVRTKQSEKGTAAGSFSSHHFLASTAHDGLGALHMQRSMSIEIFEEFADGQGMGASFPKEKNSDDSLSTLGTEDIVSGKLLKANQGAAKASFNEGQGDYAEQLRSLMAQHDTAVFKSKSANANQPTFLGQPSLTMPQQTSNQSMGGLGAALTQYNDSDGQSKIKRINSMGVIPVAQNMQLPLHNPGSASMTTALSGLSEPPDQLRSHRVLGQGVAEDMAALTLLSPERKHRGHSLLHGTFLPRHGSDPSDHVLSPTAVPTMQVRQSSISSLNKASRGFEPKSPQRPSQGTRASQKNKSKKKTHVPGRYQSTRMENTRPAGSSQSSRRRKSAFNPFRQEDEEEVLAKKSHNRRRWSHVFPLGEVEFKRHAGPNWKSLCQPAILPLTIDYHPSPQELRDQNKFYFNPYSISLRAIENSYYTNHEELLAEMVRQRITQDYQVVPQSVINESTRRGEAERIGKLDKQRILRDRQKQPLTRSSPLMPPSPGVATGNDEGAIQHTLSMGHKIHVLTYQPTSDTIEVVQYYATSALHDKTIVYNYPYLLFSQITQKYTRVVQTFEKYSNVSRWNQIDNMICGDSDKFFTEEMHYRRVMFALIPEKFSNEEAERDYIAKFKKLLDYLSKLRKRDESEGNFVKIISSSDSRPDRDTQVKKTRRSTCDWMKRFSVHLRRSKAERYEWMEMAVDPTFDTQRTFRITVNWLVASSSKIETQVQLLQRRCSQYGLRLFAIPQLSISPSLFLHPLVAPPMTPVRDKDKANYVEDSLVARGFVDDGIHMTEPNFTEVIERGNEFEFPRFRMSRKHKKIPARQYVHRSGAIFVRLIRDEQGWLIVVAFENTTFIGRDFSMRTIATSKFKELSDLLNSLQNT